MLCCCEGVVDLVASESESQLDEGADAPTRASSRSRLVERGEADVVPSSVRGSDILSSAGHGPFGQVVSWYRQVSNLRPGWLSLIRGSGLEFDTGGA